MRPVVGNNAFLRNPARFIWSRLRMACGRPLSECWGFDRGLPAHRHYITQFLSDYAYDFRGACLEFQDLCYLDQFGGPAVTKKDILHLDASNPHATVIADITQPNSIPDNAYDCIVCTHVLHVIYDLDTAVDTLYRILKPGGVLFVASPQVCQADERQGELWRFTRLGMETLLARKFGKANVVCKAYGNSLISAGELRGLVTRDFTQKELNHHDPGTASEICARAVKRR